MAFDLFNGGEDDEHDGVRVVEISGIFATESDFFFGPIPDYNSFIKVVRILQLTGITNNACQLDNK